MEARLALRIFSLILDRLPGTQGPEGARRTMCSAQALEIVRRGTKRARVGVPLTLSHTHVQHRKHITVSERSRSLPTARSPADRRVFVGQTADARFPAEWGMICVRQDAERTRLPAMGGWVRRFQAGGGC
jgi:hypothetical protein